MIERVTFDTMMEAAQVYAESWRDSHRALCSPASLARHTPEYHRDLLQQKIRQGGQVFLLTDGQPAGIVSVRGSLIENLYVLPALQNRGYGSRLLNFAIGQCTGDPALWVLNTNTGAQRLYARRGFRPTGNTVRHAEALLELELRLRRDGVPGGIDSCAEKENIV